jgi:hypothetical protein
MFTKDKGVALQIKLNLMGSDIGEKTLLVPKTLFLRREEFGFME